MTLERPRSEYAAATDAADAVAPFHAERCWYPVGFSEDLPAEGPYAFSIHDRSLVLFRDGDGRLACLADRCPHRAARLSDGRVVEGTLECGYHGWRFGADGRCRNIPQLACGAAIPAGARVPSLAVVERQGVVWVWAGAPEDAAEDGIPVLPALDRPDVVTIDFQMDLPYGQSYLVENVLDVAHIHVAHDGIRGGGRRELAGPIEFDVSRRTARGFRSTFRTAGPAAVHAAASLRGASVAFVAPNLVHYESEYADPAKCSGLALYSLPIGRDRCRLVYRAYSNFWSGRERRKPRWAHHRTQCTILEQDLRLVVGQSEEIRRAGIPLRKLWLPVRTSDALVVEYRRWLDEHGASIPDRRGFATAAPEAAARGGEDGAPVVDRFTLHTRICGSCSRVHRFARRAERVLLPMAAALLGVAVLTAGSGVSLVAGGTAFLAVLGAWAARAAASHDR